MNHPCGVPSIDYDISHQCSSYALQGPHHKCMYSSRLHVPTVLLCHIVYIVYVCVVYTMLFVLHRSLFRLPGSWLYIECIICNVDLFVGVLADAECIRLIVFT